MTESSLPIQMDDSRAARSRMRRAEALDLAWASVLTLVTLAAALDLILAAASHQSPTNGSVLQ